MTARPRAALAAALLLWTPALAQTTATPALLGEQIDRVLEDADFDGADWGVYVEDLDSGDVLYARDAESGYIPASNMKLVTTATALDVLGPDFRFETRLYADGPVAYGTLDGALVVRGSGDPRFGGRPRAGDLDDAFGQWADDLLAARVRRVTGPVVLFDDVVESPDGHFLRRMRSAFEGRGLDLMTDSVLVIADGHYPGFSDLELLSTHRSAPLADYVGWTNTESDNLYAERILRAVAAHVFPSPGPVRPSLRAGSADRLLMSLGVEPTTFVVADGSGLSRDNRMTPVGTVALLRGMWGHPDAATREAFVRSLPVGGRTGTLERRYRSGDARGNVRAKTGYIRQVRTLSGYVTTATGRTLAFSLMCNGYRTRTSRVNRAQDDVVELLADYVGRPRRSRASGRDVPAGVAN